MDTLSHRVIEGVKHDMCDVDDLIEAIKDAAADKKPIDRSIDRVWPCEA